MSKVLTKRNGAVALALVLGLVAGTAATGVATDNQLPADKTAVAGSAVQDVQPNAESLILEQRMKVSSPADLILGMTAECTILTRLITDNARPSANTTGTVMLRVEIDGKVVPVQTVGFSATSPADDGRVTFCNRTYQRTVTNEEDDAANKIDKQDDYIRTKTANGFNWVALNAGVDDTEGGYDNVALNGNNIIDIKVYAEYVGARTEAPCLSGTESCSVAYVGKRTLVIEPVHAANGEQSEPAGSSTSGGGSDSGLSIPGI